MQHEIQALLNLKDIQNCRRPLLGVALYISTIDNFLFPFILKICEGYLYISYERLSMKVDKFYKVQNISCKRKSLKSSPL